MGKIIVVDDDVDMADNVGRWLRLEQHTVDVAHTVAECKHYLRISTYDVVILDWNMQEPISGLDICKDFRRQGGESLVLILTGRSETKDVEEGLDSGADDYLKKPFTMDELSAKVRALMRRSAGPRTEKIITAGDLTLDPVAHEVRRGRELIVLMPLEFELLKFFMLNAGKVLNIELIKARVWSGRNRDESTVAAVRKYLRSLRAKLCSEDESAYIQTVHSVGYRFSPTNVGPA